MEGWIKLHRSMLEWEWIDNPNVLLVFIHCLLRANYQDTKYHGEDVERGTFITSYSKLSESTGLTIKQVRSAIEKLTETGEVRAKSGQGKKHTVIRVCNYDKFQEGEVREKSGRSEGEVRATDKNINNINNNPNSNYIYNAREDEDDFEDFKVAKKVRLSVKKPPDMSNYSERTRQYIEEYRRSKA